MNDREDVIRSPQFQSAKKAVKRKRKSLLKMGKGKKPNSATRLSAEDEEMLWQSEELGTHSAHSLVNTVWLIVQELFALKKGRAEGPEKCLWGDITLENNCGWEYLELHERETKSITGHTCGSEKFLPKAYANLFNPARCPVQIYKKYREKRHPNSLLPISPFFVTSKKSPAKNSCWFKNQKMGKNPIFAMLGNMARRADIPGKKTVKSLVHSQGIPFFATFKACFVEEDE